MKRVAWALLVVALGAGCGGQVANTRTGDGCSLDATEPPNAAGPPATLLASGLYCNAVGDVRADVLAYAPRFSQWADGAEEHRFLHLPPGGKIDVTHEDGWALPVGARIWKDASVNDDHIETMLLERFGPGKSDFTFMPYEWRADGSDADAIPSGDTNVRGTGHDIPDVRACVSCHDSTPERVLGLGAVQTGGTNFEHVLWEAGKFTVKPAAPQLPEEPTALAALGYLHANCGHCHGASGLDDTTGLDLRLTADTTDPTRTRAYRTAVSIPTVGFERGTLRVSPGAPDASAIVTRMASRGSYVQMPPLDTKVVDPAGLDAVRAWIESL